MSDDGYSISELEAASGTKRRTIHHWVAMGLLPPPEGAGPRARYTPDHLLRLRLITLLRMAGISITRIRQVLNEQDEKGMTGLLKDLETGSVVDMQRLREKLEEEPEAAEELLGMDTAPQQISPRHRQSRPDRRAHSLRFSRQEDRYQTFGVTGLPTDAMGGREEEPAATGAEEWRRIRLDEGMELAFRPRQLRLSEDRLEQLVDLIRSFLRRGRYGRGR